MLKIGVLFGGRSGEHEVSLKSALSVLHALDQEKYSIIPIGLKQDGSWHLGVLPHRLTDADSPILPSRALQEIDVAMPILHGTYGEDGAIQGMFEMFGIPYVGAGVVGSAVGMDKAIFKHVMETNGLPVLPWELVLSSDWHTDPSDIIDQIESALTYPVFVKPANLGSSVGISKCVNRSDLYEGMMEAASYDRRIVVEQGAEVRELEVAVLGNDQPQASIVGEIRPKRDFYDYVAKYVSDDSDLLIPAPLEEKMAEEVRELAVKAYEAIDCAGLGRVDFLLADGVIYINEINTIPGFTSISMYPKLWEASGLSYPLLLDRLIELAIDRHRTKTNLRTEFATTGEKA